MTTLTRKQNKQFLKDIKSKPNKVYEDLEFYKLLRDELVEQFRNSEYVEISECFMGHNMDYFYYSNNSTCIEIGPAYMRFGTRAKSIDVSRVDVPVEHQRKGLGKMLMEIFLQAYAITAVKNRDKVKVPDLILECCGSCGFGDTKKYTPVHQQVQFFSKFGFEVTRTQNNYVHMKMNEEKFVETIKKINQQLRAVLN